jgi:hypothetical protein
MIESHVHYVLDALRTLRERSARFVDVKPSVQAQFNDEIQARLDGTVSASGCASWYLDDNGKNRTLWPGFTFRYRQATDAFCAEDYELAEVA